MTTHATRKTSIDQRLKKTRAWRCLQLSKIASDVTRLACSAQGFTYTTTSGSPMKVLAAFVSEENRLILVTGLSGTARFNYPIWSEDAMQGVLDQMQQQQGTPAAA